MAKIRVITENLWAAEKEIISIAVKMGVIGAKLIAISMLAPTYDRNTFGPTVRSICRGAGSTAQSLRSSISAPGERLASFIGRITAVDEGGIFAKMSSWWNDFVNFIKGEDSYESSSGVITSGTDDKATSETTIETSTEDSTSAEEIVAITSPALVAVNPSSYSSCARYAAARRPDLGTTQSDNEKYADGAAANYICKFEDTAFQIDDGDNDLTEIIGKGYALVWEPGVGGSHETYGHVAIIEEVHEDYVIVSQAGWGGDDVFTIEEIKNLWLIP